MPAVTHVVNHVAADPAWIVLPFEEGCPHDLLFLKITKENGAGI